MICVFAARLPSTVWLEHAETVSAPWKPARLRNGGDWRGSRNLAQTLVYQGKQAVNLLVRRPIFLTNHGLRMCILGVIRPGTYPGM
jgi:hypothetical protein